MQDMANNDTHDRWTSFHFSLAERREDVPALPEHRATVREYGDIEVRHSSVPWAQLRHLSPAVAPMKRARVAIDPSLPRFLRG